jgi:uncharacterized membrane protein YgcG
VERAVHIEFTQLPDPDRERRHMRLLLAHQFRGRRVLMIVLAILMVLLGAVLIATGAVVFGAALLAFGALYPLLELVSFRRSGDRFVRRFAKINSVPKHVTITAPMSRSRRRSSTSRGRGRPSTPSSTWGDSC